MHVDYFLELKVQTTTPPPGAGLVRLIVQPGSKDTLELAAIFPSGEIIPIVSG